MSPAAPTPFQEVMLRRLKADVAAQLPPKRRQVVRLPAPVESKRGSVSTTGSDEEEERGTGIFLFTFLFTFLGRTCRCMCVEMLCTSGRGYESMDARTAITAAHKTGLAKLPDVIEWLSHALGTCGSSGSADGTPPKFLLFAHHRYDHMHPCHTKNCLVYYLLEHFHSSCSQVVTLMAHDGLQLPAHISPCIRQNSTLYLPRDVIAKLANALEGGVATRSSSHWSGVPYIRIQGDVATSERHALVARFRNDPSVRVALLSVTAAGVGLDLSAASNVVFAEIPEEVCPLFLSSPMCDAVCLH